MAQAWSILCSDSRLTLVVDLDSLGVCLAQPSPCRVPLVRITTRSAALESGNLQPRRLRILITSCEFSSWVPRDRCSPRRASLERAYRNGIWSGLLKQEAAAGPDRRLPSSFWSNGRSESQLSPRCGGTGSGANGSRQLKFYRQRGVLRGARLRSGIGLAERRTIGLGRQCHWKAMRRFVVLAPNRWHGVWMNRQQISLVSRTDISSCTRVARSPPTAAGCAARWLPIGRASRSRAHRRTPVSAPTSPTPGHVGSIRHSAHLTTLAQTGRSAGSRTPHRICLPSKVLALYRRARALTTSCITPTICSNALAAGARSSTSSRDISARRQTSLSHRLKRLPMCLNATMDGFPRSLPMASTMRRSSRQRTAAGPIPPSFWRSQDHGSATRARSAGNWILG